MTTEQSDGACTPSFSSAGLCGVTTGRMLELLDQALASIPATLATTTITATPLQLAWVLGKIAQERDKADRYDAERYRFLRAHPEWMGWEHDFRADEIDRQVDEQMAKTHNAELKRGAQAPEQTSDA